MSDAQFALAWDQYKRNICTGLSSLQQNGEFVDMTLAADGHFVKVHQVVMALASPYIKELITSANCPHPIIFLNKISNTTLCSILEYIYTGEVLVTLDNFDQFLEAAQELHIKGLENMQSNKSLSRNYYTLHSTEKTEAAGDDTEEQVCYFEVTSQKLDNDQSELEFGNSVLIDDSSKDIKMAPDTYQEDLEEEGDTYDLSYHQIPVQQIPTTMPTLDSIDTKNLPVMQYTVSNKGSLQMILNRFLYYLKHTNRNNSRQWRCVDYVSNIKCPALVVTKDDFVVQRVAAHTHPFHDKKILKKVSAGAIFSAIQEAEIEQRSCKRKKPTEDDTMQDIETSIQGTDIQNK